MSSGATRIVVIAASLLSGATALAEPVTTVRDSGSPFNRVDIVIVGEGYTAQEVSEGKFAADVEAVVDRLFWEQPYREYQRFFNVHRVDLASNESGADHPSRGVYRDTALGATFECSGIPTLVCVDSARLNEVLDRSIPDINARDVVTVLVNDPEYGGLGGSYAVASMHPAAPDILLHEMGHSFALLDDEYAGPPPPSCWVFEPAAPNVTMETRREAIKWQAWIDGATPIPTAGPSEAWPGLYEGARYCTHDMFRPTYNSKMRSLAAPFEQINVEAHVKRTYNRVSPIDAVSPAPGTLEIGRGEEASFQVSTPTPMTHALDVAWSVDGAHLASGPVFRLVGSDFSPGSHTVTVTVSDPTPFVRSDPVGLLRASEKWTIEVVGSAPFGGTPRAVPGTIQAEDFDEGGKGVAYHDTTAGNTGGAYRNTDVDLQTTSDAGGGYNAGWMTAGEWLTYTVAVAQSRTYTLTARVASHGAGGTFHVEVDGVDKTGPLTIPDTGGWQTWRDVTATVTLSAGVRVMRVVADGNGPTGVFGNLNFVRLAAAASGPAPLGGTARAVPGTIQAEDFDEGGKGVAYHDTTTGNTGGAYRNTDVDLQTTSDGGGGYNVGWMTAGEWLTYTVAVKESRTYTLTARVASQGAGGTFHVEVDGVNKTGPLTIPDTGGWQTWRDVTATVTLSAGVRVMRVVADGNGPTGVFGNLNFVRIE